MSDATPTKIVTYPSVGMYTLDRTKEEDQQQFRRLCEQLESQSQTAETVYLWYDKDQGVLDDGLARYVRVESNLSASRKARRRLEFFAPPDDDELK